MTRNGTLTHVTLAALTMLLLPACSDGTLAPPVVDGDGGALPAADSGHAPDSRPATDLGAPSDAHATGSDSSARVDAAIADTGADGQPSDTRVTGGRVFEQDHNASPLGVVDQSYLSAYYNTGNSSGVDSGTVQIVEDPEPGGTHGRCLRVQYEGGQINFGGVSGAQWRTSLGGTYDELFLAYDIYVPTGHSWGGTSIGGKLPGLMGGPKFYTGGKSLDGTDGWSGRLLWKVDGEVAAYLYVANKPGDFGWKRRWDDGAHGQVKLREGWNRLEVRHVMNTIGRANGVMQGWLNGELALDVSDIEYRRAGGESTGVDTLLFSTFYGGGNLDFAPPSDQFLYFDNFVVDTAPIYGAY